MKDPFPKNSHKVLVDIKKPDLDYVHASQFETVDLGRELHLEEESFLARPTRFAEKIFAVFFFVLLLFGGVVAFRLYTYRATLASSGEEVVRNFSVSLDSLRNFEPEHARQALRDNTRTLSAIEGTLGSSQKSFVFEMLGSIIPAFRDVSNLITQTIALNTRFLELTETFHDITEKGLRYFQTSGPELVTTIAALRESLQSVIEETERLRNSTAKLKSVSPFFEEIDHFISEEYVRSSAELHRWDSTLGALYGLLGSSRDAHILLLVQDQLSLRPGGGAIIGYGDLRIRNGQIHEVRMRDASSFAPSSSRYLAPSELALYGKEWRASDALWFFNTPDSLRVALSFFEGAPRAFDEDVLSFDGVISINGRVFERLLEITGPLTLSTFSIPFFVPDLLRLRESRGRKVQKSPEFLLDTFMRALLARLAILSESEHLRFTEELALAIKRKDLVFFAKDVDLAGFLRSHEADGSHMDLPNGFVGSYLGLSAARLTGEALEPSYAINASLHVDSDGSILHDVTLTPLVVTPNTRVPAYEFVQVFANPESQLLTLQNSVSPPRITSTALSVSGLFPHERVLEIEQSRVFLPTLKAWVAQAFGKTIFSAWIDANREAREPFLIRYETRASPDDLPQLGRTFRFIFDRQAGAIPRLNVRISAPPGFVWQESGSSVFQFVSGDPKAREVFDLTLAR